MAEEAASVEIGAKRALRVVTRSGKVVIIAEPRADVRVASGMGSVAESGPDPEGCLRIGSAKAGSASLELRCPEGIDVNVGTASGSVDLRGTFGGVRVTTASGSIRVGHATRLDLRSASGDIEIHECRGPCRVQTMSGKATVGRTGAAAVSTVSGRVVIHAASGSVQVNSASGRVEVASDGAGDVTVKTMTGAVTVRLPSGVHPSTRLRSLSGRSQCDFEEGSDCRVAVSSLSGRIEVLPA